MHTVKTHNISPRTPRMFSNVWNIPHEKQSIPRSSVEKPTSICIQALGTCCNLSHICIDNNGTAATAATNMDHRRHWPERRQQTNCLSVSSPPLRWTELTITIPVNHVREPHENEKNSWFWRPVVPPLWDPLHGKQPPPAFARGECMYVCPDREEGGLSICYDAHYIVFRFPCLAATPPPSNPSRPDQHKQRAATSEWR